MVKSTTFLQHELKNLHCIYEIFLFQFLRYDCFKFFARRQEKKARVIELSGLLASGAITACSRQCHLYFGENLFEELSCHLSSFFRSFGLFQFARKGQCLPVSDWRSECHIYQIDYHSPEMQFGKGCFTFLYFLAELLT